MLHAPVYKDGKSDENVLTTKAWKLNEYISSIQLNSYMFVDCKARESALKNRFIFQSHT